MTELARGALELRDLVERFSSISEGALRACDTIDTAVLTASLDARDVLVARAATLAAELRAQASRLSRDERASFARAMEPVSAAAARAVAVNALLQQRADEARHEVGRELDALRREAGATSAYIPSRSGAFDTIR